MDTDASALTLFDRAHEFYPLSDIEQVLPKP